LSQKLLVFCSKYYVVTEAVGILQ